MKGDYQPIGVVAAVTGSIAYGVHTYDQGEIKRIEGDRKLSEQFWKAEVERYKHDLQLAHTQDYEPYQAAVSKKKGRKRGGIGGLKEEEKQG